MKQFVEVLLCAVLLILPGCGEHTYLDQPLPAPSSDAQELAFGMNSFATALYTVVDGEVDAEENLVFSPCSISTCLGMARAGAAGTTAAQMDDVLHYTLGQDLLHVTLGQLTEKLVAENSLDTPAVVGEQEFELTTAIANAGWLQQDYGIADDYVSVLQEQYRAGVSFVDFSAHFDEIDDEINSWADNQTNGKIPKLVGETDITPDTRLVLVNTVYLKGSWHNPFDARMTQERTFYTATGQELLVPMMTQTGVFDYAADDLVQAVSLPLVSGTLSLVVMLPRAGAFDRVEAALSAGGLHALVHAQEQTEVCCTLPRFAVRFRRSLNEDLQALGMTDAFGGAADFSGITGGPNGLFISFVIHEAVIEVQEKGIEAAAATAVGIAETASPEPPNPDPPIEFTADRPFFFLIHDSASDAVLFLGRVMEPEDV